MVDMVGPGKILKPFAKRARAIMTKGVRFSAVFRPEGS